MHQSEHSLTLVPKTLSESDMSTIPVLSDNFIVFYLFCFAMLVCTVICIKCEDEG